MGEMQLDSILNASCSKDDIRSSLQHLLLISELRAMNLNLKGQLAWRISRMGNLEQELWHTKTLLKALSRCNEIIIKAEDEQKMLQEVCQTISSQIGYPLVWVGYARRDREQIVEIMACSGHKKDLAGELKIHWDESPYGHGPTAIAIKTGQPAHVEDVDLEPGMQCWSELCNRVGIREVLSLPIAYSGVGFGALTITSQHSGGFSGESREYLESVAQNMGYGVWFLRQPENFSIEYRGVSKTGETLWILTRGKVVQSDQQGRPLRMVGTNVDLTERKLMEQELSQAKKSTEIANKAKDRFLENMNHELRTPLNGIMSVLQTLADSDLKPAEKEYVEMALNSSSQLLASLNKILELSSLQNEIQQVHSQPFDLHEEMSNLVSFFQPQARNKEITLELDIHDDVPSRLVSDVAMLRQVVWNLVDNAVKYTQEGKVVLRISKQTGSGHENAGNAVPLFLEVEDTGDGIPYAMQKDVFEPFVIGEHNSQKSEVRNQRIEARKIKGLCSNLY